MDVYTATTAIAAPASTVFDYLSTPENQPEWAVNFVKATRADGDGRYTMTTPMGEMRYRIDAYSDRGTIDWYMETPNGESVLPARVVQGPGVAIVTFTLTRAPGQPMAAWESGKHGMDEELDHLRAILEGDSA